MKNFVSKIIAGSVLLSAIGMVSSHAFAQDATGQRVRQLEERLQVIQSELEKVKSQSNHVTQKVESIGQKTNPTETNKDRSGSHMVFFRGGFAHSSQHRNGMTFQSTVVPAGAQD